MMNLIAAAVLLLPAAAPRTAPAAPRPNIILVLADDLGYGGLGCYGSVRVATPRLDRLAAEGIRFTQFYAGSTVCAPSRCCLMTGLHTGRARIRGNGTVPLRPEDLTVAEVLRKAGYATGAVGKWGLGEEDSTGIPNRQGFDEWFGFLNQVHAHNYYPEFLWRNTRMVSMPGNLGGQRREYAHDRFTDEALAFIDRHHRGGPFFLYLAYTIPHANNERQHDTGNGMEVPDFGSYADRDWSEPQKGYGAMIERMDRDVGRLVDRLRELGIDRRTLVLFTSDNGPHAEGGYEPGFFNAAGPLRGIKRDLYEGGIRVPMIAWWPESAPAGTVSDHVWAMWDFLPTAAELAGAEIPPDLDGLSMAAALLGRSPLRHEYLYWEFHERGFHQAVRSGDFKAVRHNLGPVELYDLAADPSETTDIAGRHPTVVAGMQARMDQARTDSPDWPVRPATGG